VVAGGHWDLSISGPTLNLHPNLHLDSRAAAG
jgi:hypothetical protein